MGIFSNIDLERMIPNSFNEVSIKPDSKTNGIEAEWGTVEHSPPYI